jgi:hypothetical protein
MTVPFLTPLEIGTSLGRLCRYAGRGHYFYSVLQHSFCVSDLVPDQLRFFALTHDMFEAHTSDICSPWKTEEFRVTEYQGLAMMYAQQNVRLPNKEEEAEIKKADLRARAGEVWSVGEERLQSNYPVDRQAQCLTWHYYKMFSIEDLVANGGAAPRVFVERYFKYKDSLH